MDGHSPPPVKNPCAYSVHVIRKQDTFPYKTKQRINPGLDDLSSDNAELYEDRKKEETSLHRTPNPRAGGSNPSWPASFFKASQVLPWKPFLLTYPLRTRMHFFAPTRNEEQELPGIVSGSRGLTPVAALALATHELRQSFAAILVKDEFLHH